ncbi:hypothetical protein EAE96_001772 [Botrytis aclada]|nr:hypothetical protein EAE96_001772 [Botrytis aclada]
MHNIRVRFSRLYILYALQVSKYRGTNITQVNPHSFSIQSNKFNSTLSTSSASSPWQYLPVCSNVTSTSSKTPQFCLYTSTTFASSRGISLLTTPRIASKIASLPAFTSSLTFQPLHNPSSPAPFETRQLPGRGMGVIATRHIKRGAILFAYPTIGIYHNSAFPRSHNFSPPLQISPTPSQHTNRTDSSTTAKALSDVSTPINTFGEDFLG